MTWDLVIPRLLTCFSSVFFYSPFLNCVFVDIHLPAAGEWSGSYLHQHVNGRQQLVCAQRINYFSSKSRDLHLVTWSLSSHVTISFMSLSCDMSLSLSSCAAWHLDFSYDFQPIILFVEAISQALSVINDDLWFVSMILRDCQVLKSGTFTITREICWSRVRYLNHVWSLVKSRVISCKFTWPVRKKASP